MAIPASGNQVSIKDILDEKQEATTARENVSLKGLSVDGVNDYQNTDITGTPNAVAPYAISEFHGYSQNAILLSHGSGTRSWPSYEPTNWGTLTSSYHGVGENAFGPAEAFAYMRITRDDSNKRLKISTTSGTAAAMATTYNHYVNYTGMVGATFACKFSWTGGTTGPGGSNGYADNNPVMAGFDEDTYYSLASDGSYRYFDWISQRTSGGGNGYAQQTAFDLTFTIKISLNGTDYTSTSVARGLHVSARRGLEP